MSIYSHKSKKDSLWLHFTVSKIVTPWRNRDETTRNKITDAASAATLMTEMPAIIKRPLLCVPGKPMLLGFSESSYQQFFHEV